MLVLSRNLGKKLMIEVNQEITITILEINENQVKLGIEAERTIPIVREEILNNRYKQNFKKICVLENL